MASALAAAFLLLASHRRRDGAGDDDRHNLAWTASLAEPAQPTGFSLTIAPRPRAERTAANAATAATSAAVTGEPTLVGVRAGPMSEPPPSLPARRRSAGPTRTIRSPAVEEVEAPLAPAAARHEEPAAVAVPVAKLPTVRAPKRNPVPADWIRGVDGVQPHQTVARQPVTRQPVAPPPPAPVAGTAARAVAGAGARPAPRPAARPIAGTASRPSPAPPAAAPAVPAVRRRAPAPPPVEAYPFPIEEYEVLIVAEILPLLPELDDQELLEVLIAEQAGRNRVAILNRIDALLEGED